MRLTYVSYLEKWLKSGRRSDYRLAAGKWNWTRPQYNSAIATLRRRYDIDADTKVVRINGRRYTIATHTLVR